MATISNGILSFDIYQQCLDRTVELLHSRDTDTAVLGTGADLQYLIGSAITSHECLTALVVTVVGTTTLTLPAVERRDLPLCAIGDSDADVVLWEDGENPRRVVADLASHADTLAVGTSLTAGHLIPIQDLIGVKTVLAGDLLRELFACKDAAEIDQLREASAAIDRVHARVPGTLRAGRIKREVADEISIAILEEEHVAIDSVIVGSAENGTNLYYDFSDRVIEEGDVVIVDIGGTLPLGYYSDCTRIYVINKPGEKEAAAWAAPREAQEAAVAVVCPGVTAAEIDVIACNSLTAAGCDEYFIHHTGHGIGLSMHEKLFIVVDNELKLEPGMVFSVEPGMYLPDEFGMWLEGITTVTEDGGEPVNNGPCDSITV